MSDRNWRLLEPDSDGYVDVIDGDGMCVASCLPPDVARLIAAAPKLCDALADLYAWCGENLTPEQLKEALHLGLDAESALAEARGEGGK